MSTRKIEVYNTGGFFKLKALTDEIKLNSVIINPSDIDQHLVLPDKIHVLIVYKIETFEQFQKCVFNIQGKTIHWTLSIIFICNIPNLKELIGDQQSMLRRIEFKLI